ncbi:MAG: MFS transporter [Nocardioidaceae bacterium]
MTRRSKVALMAAFAVDNYGSGLFLPLVLLYATRVVGLSVQTVGAVVSAAGILGFAVPPIAGRLSHRLGPKTAVVTAQILQGLGAFLYLVASDAATVFAAAALMGVGIQFFYCSLSLLIADATSGAKERSFARVGQVRAAAFGLGNLSAALVLTADTTLAMRLLVAADAVTFLVAALVLVLAVEVERVDHGGVAATGSLTVFRDRRYLVLMAATFLVALTMDVAPSGLPVFIVEVLKGPTWLASAVIAAGTVLSSVAGVRVVDALRVWRRTRSLQVASLLYAAWGGLVIPMIWLPAGWLVPYAFLGWLLIVAANKVFYPIVGALSEALPPRAARAGYMATFQYSFTLAQVVAPAVVALFAVAAWLPWLVVALGSLVAVLVLEWLRSSMPPVLDRAAATVSSGVA